ncbi:MAG: protoporphyrinogen oxidase [Candidatus Obscuribacterales bacterium]|nr:protoporphyrinogen oxidase [Candidatus Obscuribacterales bacterium]
MSSKSRIVVIGAGITGLAAAFRLHNAKEKPEIIILEASSRPGGVIKTHRYKDCLLEAGPDAFLTEKESALTLCRELALESRLIQTNEKNRRSFIAWGGILHPLPAGFTLLAPTEFLPFAKTKLLSLKGKLRMAWDLFLPKNKEQKDESLAQFVRRRFGQEALERIAQPLIGGIYTADPEKLSLKSTMPRFIKLEQKYGSIIHGLLAQKKNKKAKKSETGARYSMFASLEPGLGQLIESLTQALPKDCLHYNKAVLKIRRGQERNAYEIVTTDGDTYACDAVIICSPAYTAARMLKELDLELSRKLDSIQYASSAVLNMIYKRSDIKHQLDGFGFVVPAAEKRHIIACSFSSIKFAGRCPEDQVILRAFVGGALQSDLLKLGNDQIECLVWQDLHDYLGVKTRPLFSLLTRYDNAMPQYHIGHEELIDKINTDLKTLPGIFLAGNAYNGVGIPDCIASAEDAADTALRYS